MGVRAGKWPCMWCCWSGAGMLIRPSIVRWDCGLVRLSGVSRPSFADVPLCLTMDFLTWISILYHGLVAGVDSGALTHFSTNWTHITLLFGLALCNVGRREDGAWSSIVHGSGALNVLRPALPTSPYPACRWICPHQIASHLVPSFQPTLVSTPKTTLQPTTQ